LGGKFGNGLPFWRKSLRRGVKSAINVCIAKYEDRNAVDLRRASAQIKGVIRHYRLGQEGDGMTFIFKGVALLVVLGFVGLAGFAYLGDLSPQQQIVTKPVILDGQ
jgi:hypothetical protein